LVRFYNNGTEIETIQFPITEVGTSSTVKVTIENDSEEHIELIPYTNDKDVTITDYPKQLGPRESGHSTWVFEPAAERLQEERRALKTTCGFKEIIG
jgi:hypothetical protein